MSIAIEGALGALGDAGLESTDVDGVIGERGPASSPTNCGWARAGAPLNGLGIPAVLEAAALITTGQCQVVLMVGGAPASTPTGRRPPRGPVPTNEFVVGYGMFTAVEFALMAKRHMLTFGTTPEQMATVAATIRNNGHVNPEAVYFGRGPFKPEDILASRLIAEPFHLLDCSTTSEGGCGLVLTTADRAPTCAKPPAWILGGGSDAYGPAYQHGPIWDFTGDGPGHPRRLCRPAGGHGRFVTAGLRPATSTSASSTIRSPSRSSASSRPSGSARRARAARSSWTAPSAPAGDSR